MVSEGQRVLVGDILAEGKSFERKSINIALLLKVNPKDTPKLLIKKIGEEIKEGELLARKDGILNKASLKSPQSGTLEKLDENGILTIKIPRDEFTLRSKVNGKIIKIKDDEEIDIEFDGIEIEADEGTGSKKEGLIFALKDSNPSLYTICPELSGKIVAAKNWSREAISKARALGIAAILGEVIEGQGLNKKNDCPMLVFSSENFEKVVKYNDCFGTACGEEKSLIISKKLHADR